MRLGDRFRAAMAMYARSHGRDVEDFTQTDWVRLASQAVRKDPDTEPVMSQQNLSLILNNESAGQQGIVAFAQLLGVEAAWLQYGIGPATFLEKQIRSSR